MIPCSPRRKHEVLELSRFLTELSVCYYFFALEKPSSVALASILIAMEEMRMDRSIFEERMKSLLDLELDAEEIVECRSRLHDLYHHGGYSCETDMAAECPERVSPVCVSGVSVLRKYS
mmetsp:Transcript_4975/g.7686  ORF Transcript_4975/g.7686 Transcript_4975/m.7686 type:complete len:119 (-) Transcript_4975:299-655(-)